MTVEVSCAAIWSLINHFVLSSAHTHTRIHVDTHTHTRTHTPQVAPAVQMDRPVNRRVHQMILVSRPDLPMGQADPTGRADQGGRAAHHRALQCRQLRRQENRGGQEAPTAPAVQVVLVGQEVLVGQVKAERKDREFEGETRGGESRYREGGRERARACVGDE